MVKKAGYPNESHTLDPDDKLEVIRTFPAGSKFVRIYNEVKASGASPPYSAADFNPTLLVDKKSVRGRFSAIRDCDPSEHYSYLYIGDNHIDERCALLEAVDVVKATPVSGRKARILNLSEPDFGELSFAYFESTREIEAIDLTNEPAAYAFRAQLEHIQGKDYRIPRAWARYLRRQVPDADGIAYNPLRYGSTEQGPNLVLFAPHKSNGDMVRIEKPEVSFASREGYNRLSDLATVTGLLPMNSLA